MAVVIFIALYHSQVAQSREIDMGTIAGMFDSKPELQTKAVGTGDCPEKGLVGPLLSFISQAKSKVLSRKKRFLLLPIFELINASIHKEEIRIASETKNKEFCDMLQKVQSESVSIVRAFGEKYDLKC